jgi:separase
MGHNAGQKYVDMEHVQQLDSCATAVLMGCSSGALKVEGCFGPSGPALSYTAGSW